jgi:hypothetical protein
MPAFTPPENDELERDVDARFLCALWDKLELAVDLSTATAAMDNLSRVLSLCEEAADLIRNHQAPES